MMVTNPCERDNRVLREAKTLSNNGYKVTILALSEEKDIERKKVMEFTIKYLTRKFEVNTIRGKMDLLKNFTQKAIKEDADIYHSHDLSTLLECFIASRVNDSKLVYDSHEVNAISKNVKSVGNIYNKISEKILIKKTNGVITVNEFIAQLLKKEYDLKQKPIDLLNLPDKRYYDDIENIEENKEYIMLPDFEKKYIIYQGFIRQKRGLFELVKSFHYLDNSYQLLIVGNGPMKEDLETYVEKKQLENQIAFRGYVDYQNLINVTKEADVGIISGKGTNEGKINYDRFYGSPNKLFEYIVAGIPVITNNYPFYKKIVGNNKLGLFWKNKNPKDMARVIKNMFENEERYQEFKNNVFKIRENYVWEREEKKLIKFYEKLTRDIDE